MTLREFADAVTSTRAIVVGIAAIIVVVSGAAIRVATLSGTVSALERRVDALEQLAASPSAKGDPIATQCAELASLATVTQTDGDNIERAMRNLGCHGRP